jgi:general secretion pathway protein L
MHAGELRSVVLGDGEQLPDGPFIGLIDGALTPLLSFALPNGLKGHARRDVALRQLRDQIGVSAQGVEIQPVQTTAKDVWTHAVVKDKIVAAMIADAQLHDSASCAAVLPDFMALPAADEIWTIDVDESSSRVRIGVVDGFSGENDFTLLLLEKALLNQKPAGVLRTGIANAEIDTFLAEIGVPVVSDGAVLREHDLPMPRVFAHNELALDLRVNAQAELADTAQNIRALIWPVFMAATALGVWLISMSINTQAARDQALNLRKDTLQTVRENFVPSGPILDVQRQVTQAITTANEEASGVGENTPFKILRQAGVALNEFPNVLKSVSFSQAEGLIMRLSLADFKTLDQVVDAMKAVDLNVRVGSSDASGENQVRATVYVGAGDD